ncbi:patronin isoform X1 [Bombyx mori]|uniref:Patronin n=1 Tax=Bombyx mori TaxID=7091 RepID=A0A8R2GC09_BOMMO|nr:patronin isoform X4 [Bombyx mori]
MVAMVASGYGTLRRFLSAPEGQHGANEAGVASSASVAVSSKQRASIKWLLSKAFNNRVPENLQEPFYRDHEDLEHLKPPICGGLANAELYCLALANMYSDPNYHSLNHWNILQTLVRKGIDVPDPPDCALTETVLIQTNPLKMGAHMVVIEALMKLYAREVVTADRVWAAAQRFGATLPPINSASTHEAGILCWVNAACAAFNKAEESTPPVPTVSSLQDLCEGTSLAALVSFYCPEALPRSALRVGRVASIQDCLHNLMLVHDFCANYLPHNIFHMMPEDVTYMRGSMKQNLVAMLADLFNVLEVHPVKSVKCPGSEREACNEHGVRPRRALPAPAPSPIPDLRPDRPPHDLHHAVPFAVPRSPSACSGRPAPRRSASSTPERRSCSPQRDQFVVHRGKAVTTLASLARRDDDNGYEAGPIVPAGRPTRGEGRDSFAGRRSRRGSVSDDSQLTVENFGGSQDTLHFAGRNPEKELAIVTNVRKISAPAGPLDSYNPPLRSSRQDIRGSFQLFDDYNGAPDERFKVERPPPQLSDPPAPLRRQRSTDAVNSPTTNYFTYKGGGDGGGGGGGGGGFYLGDNRDATDGEAIKTSFADLNKIRTNGDQTGAASQFGPVETEQTDRRKTTTFSTPPLNTTTWQQQFLQQENQLNGEEGAGEGGAGGGGAMAAQLNNIRLKLEEKRRRIELDKRRAEQALSRQRQQLGHQAFLQAVTRGKGARTPPEDEPKQEPALTQDMVVEPPSQSVDNVVLEQYQQSIAKMNSSLQDIQSDIARLANQQNQLQHQQHQQHQHQQAKQLFQQQPQPQLVPQSQPPPSPAPYQQHYQPNIPQLHSQFSSQHNVARSPLSGFGSTPHLPRDLRDQREMWDQRDQRDLRDVRDQYYPAQYRDMDEYSRQQFYLHDSPPPPQRRTWAQHAQHQHEQEHRGWQLHQQSQPQYQREPEPRTWRSPSPSASPQPPAERSWTPQGFTQPFHVHYSQQNGNDTQNHLSYVVSEQQHQHHTHQQHSHQQQQPLKPQQLHQRQASPAPPPPDDMQPQNISFIGNAEDDALRHGIARLNISSGTRTYRIPSPTRPTLARNSFQQEELPENEKGFYISFDNEQPKRAKPPLRPKRMSPKKERSSEAPSPERGPGAAWGDRVPAHEEPCVPRRAPSPSPERARPSSPQPAAALLIGEMNPDPNSAEEMERKKERIMLLSLQRRQRADEARARAEAAAAARRAREDAAQELKQARKEEQARRREAILQQYKLKKAIEEAEREGKVIDKSELLESMKHGSSPASSNPRLRSRGATTRARPKTIHVDTGALHAAEGMLAKQPSATNLAAGGGSVRRDYYRGSQDSLAERAGLYRDSPVDDRGGMSPSSASSGPLGRRGSCKTSRERVNEEPQSSRGRSKYTSYQSNFKAGRKSSSLMNLCDSGLGRATPPRRAASPAHRTAASGPGSLPGALPGAIGKRRQHDDNSDVSSTHSSIMDYSGPRLYKQPTTKSNRGIMLNAVEYCVFPGAVNAEAKRRVLDEVARSESKHFLVLFRDAGCQFRALYSYCPETDLIAKLYGTGPKVVNDRMFDKFFKYNSGSKCFSQVHTKHLTVTIDAFTIHNSLWQGKKVQLPSKKDMALVI